MRTKTTQTLTTLQRHLVPTSSPTQHPPAASLTSPGPNEATGLLGALPARKARQAAQEGPHQENGGRVRSWASRAAKYALGIAGAGYVVDNFFLSTTALVDGKAGFTSNERLEKACAKAEKYYARYHSATEEERVSHGRPFVPIKTCGSNQFATMSDYRAATKVHVSHLFDTKNARESLLTNLSCLKGERIKQECIAKYAPAQVPADPDLSKSQIYDKKNKYSLTGVANAETGASGYISRSITHPFINRGMQHFKQASNSDKALSLKQCMESLQRALDGNDTLGAQAQHAAGQAILNFRQVYAADEHWGHPEKVIMKTLIANGLLSQEQTDRIDATLMFEDPSTSILKRNTSIAGPFLQKLDTKIQSRRLQDQPEALADFMEMAKQKNMEGLPIAHFKLNAEGTGFEDCSGLGDSFTSANAVACINHARLMSGEPRLSKQDVAVVVACLNAVYDDASSIRHSLHEIARGCFVGAGYSTEDADTFYEQICKDAAQAFYAGKSMISSD
ncbi:XopAG/AvrGf1 family type III secretion system effector [Xanthomonas sp. NCPPB 3582]|uniref:XopAG/AvrGf1 family type III secretion system effector n=1 Tax=Xanthomonas sp. NCPPB 3582 TaxID=487557 RepID=UPI003558620E